MCIRDRDLDRLKTFVNKKQDFDTNTKTEEIFEDTLTQEMADKMDLTLSIHNGMDEPEIIIKDIKDNQDSVELKLITKPATTKQTTEVKATAEPEPTTEVGTTPEPVTKVDITQERTIEVEATPEPTIEVKTTPESTTEVEATPAAVSYTHLTLPTIYSV